MRASAPIAWLCTLSLLGVALHARAQAQQLPEVAYDAPASCPNRAEFESRVRARVRTDSDALQRTRAALRRIEVRIELRTGRALGELVMRDAAGTAALRRIEAASCGEAVDALALIAALTLDPGGASEPPAEAPSATEPAATPQRSQPPSSERSAGTRPPVEASAAEREPVAEPTQRPSGASRAPQPSEAREGTAEPLLPPAGEPTRVGLFTSAVALTGVAPRALPGLQLAATLAISPETALELAARAGVRLTPDQSTTSAEGVATFAFWTSIAALCSGAHSSALHTSLWLCAEFELGRVAARGKETRKANSSRRTWTAVGPAVLAHWDGLDPVVIQAGVELPFTLVRDRFLIGREVVHHVPLLGFRAELGVGVQLR